MKFAVPGLLACGVFLMAPLRDASAAPLPPLKPITKTEKNIETVGTAVSIAEPVLAGLFTIYEDDRVGSAELVAETALTVGTAYGLKQFVRERRPDNSNYHSFPSTTTALAASGSSFLWGRYGWTYGLPALFATEFVAYSRVQAKQHHWYDTLASSAMAAGYGYIVTTPFKRYNIYTSLDASPDGAFLRVSTNW